MKPSGSDVSFAFVPKLRNYICSKAGEVLNKSQGSSDESPSTLIEPFS